MLEAVLVAHPPLVGELHALDEGRALLGRDLDAPDRELRARALEVEGVVVGQLRDVTGDDLKACLEAVLF